jgi:DNA helicase IV
MPRLRFRLPDRETIRRSPNGIHMLNVIENDFPEKNILITGCPGSGKTTVSIHRFIHQVLRPNPRRIQLLTFGKLLNVAIIETLRDQGVQNPGVSTLCTWYSTLTRRITGHGEWFYSDGNPDLPTAADIRHRLQQAFPNGQIDELIIDEGQDVHIKGYQSLPHVATKFTVGGDGAQPVYDQGVQDVDNIERTLIQDIGGGLRYCPLEYIYRTSFVAYQFHRRFAPDVPSANEAATLDILRDFNPGEEDDKPRIYTYGDDAIFRKRLAEILDQAILGEDTIVAILVPNQADVDRMAAIVRATTRNGQPCRCTTYYSRQTPRAQVENILITTFKSAKGMEFDTVIIPRLPSPNLMNYPDVGHTNSRQARQSKNWRRQCLVACTRAKSRLHIFCQGGLHPILRPENFPAETYVLRHLAPLPPQNNPLPF